MLAWQHAFGRRQMTRSRPPNAETSLEQANGGIDPFDWIDSVLKNHSSNGGFSAIPDPANAATGVDAAIGELATLDHLALDDFPPYQVLRADLFRRAGWIAQARAAYDAALALGPASAERKWLLGWRAGLESR